MSFRIVAASALALTVFLPEAARACSACGCNLDTDEGSAAAGFSVDERVDYVNQDSLWLGGGKAPPQDPTAVEVQRNTATLWYTTTIDYQSDQRWGVSVAVPAQTRTHSSFNNGTDGDLAKSEWNAFGDVRVLGRYALTEGREISLLAGLKLPTGGTTHNFDSGQSTGLVDRGLQPGSGTWDLLLGSSQGGSITGKLGWFAQELWQKPLEQHNGFAPGQTLNGSVGLRYAIDETFMPQFQVNAQNRWRDRGINADIPNSGGEIVYASPGLFVTVAEDTTVYGFVQLPIYQRVGGLELVPDYSASLGIKHRF